MLFEQDLTKSQNVMMGLKSAGQPYSMTHNRTRYIPSSYCYLSYPYENDVKMCPGSSNGCASGNSLEEAFLYALLELAERDAVAAWWYNRIKRPRVNLDSFNDSSLNQTQAKFKKNNREFFVLDITTLELLFLD